MIPILTCAYFCSSWLGWWHQRSRPYAGDTAAQELLWLGLNDMMTGRVFCIKGFLLLPSGKLTYGWSAVTMENGPLEDVFPRKGKFMFYSRRPFGFFLESICSWQIFGRSRVLSDQPTVDRFRNAKHGLATKFNGWNHDDPSTVCRAVEAMNPVTYLFVFEVFWNFDPKNYGWWSWLAHICSFGVAINRPPSLSSIPGSNWYKPTFS